jgi:hypothetical protein
MISKTRSEARGVRGRRCLSAWPHVADAVIAACTLVTQWSTIGCRKRCDRNGGKRMAVWLALLRGGA